MCIKLKWSVMLIIISLLGKRAPEVPYSYLWIHLCLPLHSYFLSQALGITALSLTSLSSPVFWIARASENMQWLHLCAGLTSLHMMSSSCTSVVANSTFHLFNGLGVFCCIFVLPFLHQSLLSDASRTREGCCRQHVSVDVSLTDGFNFL